jgi:hypothetical protein
MDQAVKNLPKINSRRWIGEKGEQQRIKKLVIIRKVKHIEQLRICAADQPTDRVRKPPLAKRYTAPTPGMKMVLHAPFHQKKAGWPIATLPQVKAYQATGLTGWQPSRAPPVIIRIWSLTLAAAALFLKLSSESREADFDLSVLIITSVTMPTLRGFRRSLLLR